ncbi:MAG: YIP1 family protein [Planctomycetota bacterium]
MIQVQCSKCQQVLIASEEQAGTMIPCRHCGAWVAVPGAAHGGEDSAEAPCPFCGQFILIEPGDVGMPISCPHCRQMIQVVRHAPTGRLVLQPGEQGPHIEPIPWENRQALGFLTALWRTFKEVVFSPTQFYRRMRPYGLGDAILYILVIGLFVAVGSVLQQSSWQYLAQRVATLTRPPGAPAPLPMPQSLGVLGYAIMVLLMPLIQVLSMFIASAIVHVVLMVLGGANQGYENTCRVLSYGSGAHVFGLIPICGIIAPIWFLVVTTIGLRETNRIGTGKAFLAAFTPLALALLCCCGWLLVGFGLLMTAGPM